MCYRFCIEKDEEGIKHIVSVAEASPLAEKFMVKLARPLVTSGDVRPTDVTAVIAPGRSKRRAVFPMKWGFTLKGIGNPVVNARVESAFAKPAFRDAWASHRCVIPASWYYEWEYFKTPDGKSKTGKKYSIQPSGASITYLCGLYRLENSWPVFTVLTREPSKELARIHDRMPLILPEALIDEWINPDSPPEALLPHALTDMVF